MNRTEFSASEHRHPNCDCDPSAGRRRLSALWRVPSI